MGQVNLFKAVEAASDLLTRFGGHEAAVGVTLPTANLPEFERRLCAYMDALPEGAFHPLVNIDACVSLDELTLDNVAQLDKLAPFGQEHPVPVYLARDVMLANCRAVGAEKNHFSCTLSDGRATVSGIMFHCSDIESLMRTDSVVNAAFEVQIDEWRGRKSVKAMLQSLAPARTCGALEACLNPENLSFFADLYATSDAELCANAPHRPEDVEAYEAARAANRACWERKAVDDPEGLERAIVHAIIGDRPLHDAQRDILDHLRAGRSVLGVMATGRGKSLTFQVHAAERALAHHEASLFVYPLRALIADQAFHLREALDAFGIGVITLTGESTPDERRQGFAGLADGTYDIALTTPEFLAWHADEFAGTGRVKFVVVDEAHHVGLAKAGQRVAYATIGAAIAKLSGPDGGAAPTVLALTATADDDVAAAIRRELPVDACVFDSSERSNLEVDDQRNLKNRDDYLANLIASGDKTVIFVNSREQSISVARALRKRVPQLAPLIGFYNAGLARAERKRIEELFRTDALSVLVATSAFGRAGHPQHPSRGAVPSAVQRDRIQPDERPRGARRAACGHPSAVQPRRLLAERAHPARHDARPRLPGAGVPPPAQPAARQRRRVLLHGQCRSGCGGHHRRLPREPGFGGVRRGRVPRAGAHRDAYGLRRRRHGALHSRRGHAEQGGADGQRTLP